MKTESEVLLFTVFRVQYLIKEVTLNLDSVDVSKIDYKIYKRDNDLSICNQHLIPVHITILGMFLFFLIINKIHKMDLIYELH